MKKLLAALLIAALTLPTVISCSGGNEGGTIATTESKTPAQDSQNPDPAVDTTDYRAAAEELLQSASATVTPADRFSYLNEDGSIRIVKYTGSETSVCIPAEIGGVPVTVLSADAFADNQTLEALIIPDSVVRIGAGCLKGCTALKLLDTPLLGATAEDTQFLGYLFGAQSYADHTQSIPASLSYVFVGGSMTKIADYAFAECNDVVAVVLGEQIQSVGSFAFYGCEKLKWINLERLTSIGSYALTNCRVLVRADFSTSLTSAGLGVLQGCSAISSLTLPFVGGSLSENNYLGYLFGAESSDFTAGYIPAYLRSVTLLDTCTVLGDYAFFECSSLKEVKLSATLTSIGVRAFEKCTALSEIALPATLVSIRENAFFGCTALERIAFSEGLQTLGVNVFYACTSLKEVKLPASLKALPASAFADCVALETVDFGGVDTVGKNAFRNCTALKNVVCENITTTDGNEILDSLINQGS